MPKRLRFLGKRWWWWWWMDGWGWGVAGGVAQAEGREGEDASARIRMECCSGIIVLARYLNAANSNRTNLC